MELLCRKQWRRSIHNFYLSPFFKGVFLLYYHHRHCDAIIYLSLLLYVHTTHITRKSSLFINVWNLARTLLFNFNHHHRAVHQVCAVMFFVVWQAIRCLIWWHYQKTHRSSNNLIVKGLVVYTALQLQEALDIHLGGWPLKNDDFSGGTKNCLEPWILSL